jgi:hypothetical protein
VDHDKFREDYVQYSMVHDGSSRRSITVVTNVPQEDIASHRFGPEPDRARARSVAPVFKTSAYQNRIIQF